MDTPTVSTPAPAAAALELRVTEGPQAGATAPLPPGFGCVLATAPDGDADDADVVLREPGAAPTRVRIVPAGAAATLDVLEGEVRIGEQRVAAGESRPWAPRTPLRIGGTAVAYGPAGDAWHDEPASDVPVDDTAKAEWERVMGEVGGKRRGVSPPPPPPPPPPRRVRVELVLAAVGAVAVVACVATLLLRDPPSAERQSDAPPPADPVVQLVESLQSTPFAALDVIRDPLGRITLNGRVATLADRQRLDAWLAQQPLKVGVNVHVDEAIVRDVTDVFRVNGVAVNARVAGPGRIVVDAAEKDPAQLARAEEVVRRDVRGLAGLEVSNRVAPPPKPAPVVVDDPAKRIASVVPGKPAYLVTADGARYFVGALLPGNLRIVRIAGTAVVLERDGETTTLNF